jgi:hypothetical protein
LSLWADREIRTQRGVNVEKKAVPGPETPEASPALQVSFDQPPLGKVGPVIHMIVILWQFRDRLIGAELSFEKDDPNASRDAGALGEIVRSFRPT